ncbi:MAG: ATP-binding protein [Aggregatilineales bacterium]
MLKRIGIFIGADRAYIYHFTPDATLASMMHEWCSERVTPEITSEQNISTTLFQEAFERFRQGDFDIIPDVSSLPDTRKAEKDRLIAREIGARITLPLFVDEQLFGSMGFHAAQANPGWADHTVDLLKIVSEIYLNLLDRYNTEYQVQYQANLLQNITEAVFATDIEGFITSWNQAAERLYGYKLADVIGKHIHTVIQAEYPDSAKTAALMTISDISRQLPHEMIHYSRHNIPIDVIMSVSAITDNSNNRMGYVFVIHDLRNRKAAEAQRLKMAIQDDRIQFLERVIGNLSHDLKNPISSLQLLVYILRKQADPEKQKDYLDRMETGFKRLNHLVDDILTVDNLSSTTEITLISFDIMLVIQHAISMLQPVATEKGVQLHLEKPTSLPSVYGNQAALSSAIMNIIENAIHYTPREQKVVVRVYTDEKTLIIEVEDSGIGIHIMDLPHIFEHFHRTNEARNMKQDGVGLGLAIAKNIIDLHEGTIEVESEVSEGSIFRVKLPLLQAMLVH